MKTLLSAFAVLALALPSCTKAPDPAPPVDEYAKEEIQQLRQDVRDLKAYIKPPNTTGLEAADIGRRMMQQDQRIKSLEEQLAAATKAGGSVSADPSTSSTSHSSASTTSSVVPAEASDYSPQQISDFRKILDVVEKQKRDEQAAERIKVQLTRFAADLTPDQEKAVTSLTLALQQKRGEVIRGGFGTSDVERKATQEKIEALAAQYESDIRAIPQLPTSVADKVVESLGRGFGAGPRRIDGTTNRNAMGN